MHRRMEEQTSPTNVALQSPHVCRLDGLFEEVPQGGGMGLELAN